MIQLRKLIITDSITLDEFFNTYKYKNIVPISAICKSGLYLSIQASRIHYCSPRANVNITQYTSLEVGFPNRIIPEILEYAGDKDNPTNTVYAYVPRTLIEKILEENGGIISNHESYYEPRE